MILTFFLNSFPELPKEYLAASFATVVVFPTPVGPTKIIT